MGATHGLRLCVRVSVAGLAVPLAAILGTPAQAQVRETAADVSWPGTSAVCPNETVLVARGSDEAPQTDPLQVSSYNEQSVWGLGGPGARQADALWFRAESRDLTMRKQGVVYPALPVPDRANEFEGYLESIDAGADGIVSAVADYINDPAWCPGDGGIHLVGYSQGAWSVRIAVNRLARRYGDPCCHGMPFLASVTLFGDPTYDSREEISRWGHKPAWGHDFGIAHLARMTRLAPDAWFAPYSWMVRDRVSSYCLKDDLVCRTPRRWDDLLLKTLALKWSSGLEGHLSYSGDVIDAASKFGAKSFTPVPTGMEAFAQEVLHRAEIGDVDWLRGVWGPYYDYWPEDLIADVGGSSGTVDSCSYYGACLAILANDPSVRWSMRVNGSFEDGYTVNEFSPSSGY